jgi:hypothetical protein
MLKIKVQRSHSSRPVSAASHAVFTHHSFLEAFFADLAKARGRVLIQSPYLAVWRLRKLRPSLVECVKRGVRICVFVQQPKEEYLLEDSARIEALNAAASVLQDMGAHLGQARESQF